MRDKDALIFVYDLTKDKSFAELEEDFYKYMCEVYEDQEQPILLLCGNKLDLAEKGSRKVQSEDAMNAAKRWGAIFFECSALSGHNIQDIFLTAVRCVDCMRCFCLSECMRIIVLFSFVSFF